jgi:pimeloyl-ACP methyl ester carboxylesterase
VRPAPAGAPPALLLHGGPGLSDYLESLADELDGVVTTARYQQRGISPSLTTGSRDVERHVEDAVAVLDALGWDRAIVIGHSWGGYLAFHFGVSHPERLLGVVSIDPLGAVGDGGLADFQKRLTAQLTPVQRQRHEYLDLLEKPTTAQREEDLRILWPYYFGDPAKAAPYRRLRFDSAATDTWASIIGHAEAGTLEKALPTLAAPLVVIHGEESPIPIAAAAATVGLAPNGRLVAIPGVGHWAWLEQPGVVRQEVQRLVESISAAHPVTR